MAQRFGHDFSQVRVHSDERAAEAAQLINARAFTAGQDVVFGAGQYAPSSSSGQRLIAHELTHTIQQENAATAKISPSDELAVSDPADSAEQEATTVADQVLSGAGPAPIQRSPLGVSRTGGPPMVQRSVLSWLETQGHNIAEAVGLEDSFDANLGRANAFRDNGVYGPKDVTPGNSGGFEVSYDPTAGEERIVMRIAVHFIDALTMSGGTISPVHANLQGAVDRAAALPPAAQAGFVARYQWTDGEKSPWMDSVKNSVKTAWEAGGKHEFHVNRPQWEWLGAKVKIDLQTREETSGKRASYGNGYDQAAPRREPGAVQKRSRGR